jgi:hypothetical protein
LLLLCDNDVMIGRFLKNLLLWNCLAIQCMNRNLYGRFCIKFPQSRMKGELATCNLTSFSQSLLLLLCDNDVMFVVLFPWVNMELLHSSHFYCNKLSLYQMLSFPHHHLFLYPFSLGVMMFNMVKLVNDVLKYIIFTCVDPTRCGSSRWQCAGITKIRLTMPRVKMSRADRNPWLAKMHKDRWSL